jgi:hypothetical protein
VDAPYEPPERPDLTLGGDADVAAAALTVLEALPE